MELFPISVGDYAYVESGSVHTYRAEKPTWVLEIQFGYKCEETDIVRL